MNTLNDMRNIDEIMDAKSIDEYLEKTEAIINAKQPADKPRKITANFIARECCDTEIIKTWKKMLEWISCDAGGSIEIKIENNHNPYNIDSINIDYSSGDLYTYSLHTREYKEDYTHKDMAHLDEMLEILTLAIFCGKTFDFIDHYNQKKKEMESYSRLLLDSNLLIEFDAESILLTEPLTYDRFIREQVPNLAFLGPGQGWWIELYINYKWDHHPNWVTHMSADSNDDDSLNLYMDIFENDDVFKRVRKKNCTKEDAIGIFWDVLIREQLPKDIDDWEDITHKKGKEKYE